MRSFRDPQALTKRVQQYFGGREILRNRHKVFNERADDANKADNTLRTDFWCGDCFIDFTTTGYKVSKVNSHGVPHAYYVAKCPKGHRCVRYITDKHTDPFFTHSRKLTVERRARRKDYLRPEDEGFRTLYGEAFRERDEELEAAEASEYFKRKNHQYWD